MAVTVRSAVRLAVHSAIACGMLWWTWSYVAGVGKTTDAPTVESQGAAWRPGVSAVADSAVELLRTVPEVREVEVGFEPSAGLVLHLRIGGVTAVQLRSWLAKTLLPLADPLKRAAVDPSTRVVVLVDGDGLLPIAQSGRSTVGKMSDDGAWVFELASAWSPPSTTVPGGKATTTVPTKITALATTTTVPKSTISDDFSAGDKGWKSLSGRWSVVDGVFRQADVTPSGGFVTQWKAATTTASTGFALSVTVTFDGTFGGGLMVGQPKVDSKVGATLVEYGTSAGAPVVKWGHFDQSGLWVFDGESGPLPGLDVKSSSLMRLEVRGQAAVVTVDGKQVGTFVAAGAGPGVGLAASASAGFDDVKLEQIT